MQKVFEAPKPTLIYVIRISDDAHRGCLKIGETSFEVDEDSNVFDVEPNSTILNEAAIKRVKQYTQTAGVKFELLYTECTRFMRGSDMCWFNDKEIHSVLLNSGIVRKKFDGLESQGNEWFETDLETVKNAITAVKEGRKALSASEVTQDLSPIDFRPEQRKAIDDTKRRFRRYPVMLWNAKMRFGKTWTALQVIKEMGFARTLIYTHRPEVLDDWYSGFKRVFYDRDDYQFGSKRNVGSDLPTLQKRHDKEGLNYIFFASLQDLRGSKIVGGNFEKNDDIFSTKWDFIITDEAHEGTQTALGKAVFNELTKCAPKRLELTGTAFNLLKNYTEEEVFTWDYTMEQRAKAEWDRNHYGDPNPYAGLPAMKIFTYDLGTALASVDKEDYVDGDVAFNFREFFRTNADGEFVHQHDVKALLNLLTQKESNYPFANERYRDIFRHTLWMLPGVKAAKALSVLLKAHPVFSHFDIVNVAGEGDEEEDKATAYEKVKNAINGCSHGTITLSCCRLTTGVSIPQWMGVLMLAGSYNTSAPTYMQTIFRVQTPYSHQGLVKQECYVFDFAPDRALKILASVPRVNTKAGKTTQGQREALAEFLNFCPVIGMEGSVMKPYDVNTMMEQLKKAYIDSVVQNGFEDSYLYNDELTKLDKIALKDFDKLKGLIGQSKAMGNSGNIDVNSQGLTDEEYEKKEDIEKKPPRERTEEEKKRLEELREKARKKREAISILRGISIRMPLLIYGAEIVNEDEQLSIDNFTSLVDAKSWEEFMPAGVTKDIFNKFKKYYDPDVFSAAAKRIRAIARAADLMTIEDRIERITDIFSSFRNPDKETVLTPWRVVNMHMSDTLGGYTFYNEDFTETLSEPRYVDHGEVTHNVFSTGSRLLEINSKSGLYPLYLAYNMYRSALKEQLLKPTSLKEHLAIWDTVVAENIFVICKTPMAKAITRRTLMGFRKGKINTRYFEDLINKIKNQPELFIKKVHDLVGKNVKINAIVGNPPYQETKATEKTIDNAAFASAVYPLFFDIANKLKPTYISLIMPSRWMTKVGQGISDVWVDYLLNSNHFIKLVDFLSSQSCFTNVEIKGGICYFLFSNAHSGDCKYILTDTQNNQYQNIGELNELGTGVVIRDGLGLQIIKHIKAIEGSYFNDNTFRDMVSPKHFYDKDNLLSSNWTGFATQKDSVHTIKFYVNKKLSESGFGWITESDIPRNIQTLSYHKVYIPKVGGSGTDAYVLGKPFYGEPNSVCSYTYLVIGYNQESKRLGEFECNAIIKYIQSRLFRYLVSLKKKTQDNARDVFQFVPLQDFTEGSDIDWSASVDDIDKQLFAKYDLTEEEIAFINSMIKPMK